jgi:hypothetical protein
MIKKIFLSIIFLTTSVFSDIAVTPEARKKLSLTIYENFGIIKETRSLNIPVGNNRIRFEGVASEIHPSAVLIEWPANVDLDIISQSYEYDLVSPNKLMEKYIGKQLEILPGKMMWSDSASVSRSAELIGLNNNTPVFRVGTKITYGDIGQVLFPYIPDNLYIKPTLLLDINSQKRFETELSATYLTNGIGWKSNYILKISSNMVSGQLSGWITVANTSGMEYRNANVMVISGKLPDSENRNSLLKTDKIDNSENSFMQILQPNLSIEESQNKQFQWISDTKITFTTKFNVDFTGIKNRNNGKVTADLELINSKQNGLGYPICSGSVRIFKEDPQGNRWFVGDNEIDYTSVNKSCILTINADNVLFSEKHRIKKTEQKNDVFEIMVKNNNEAEVLVTVKDFIDSNKITNSTEIYSLKGESVAEWLLRIPAKGSKKVQYTLQRKM